jgi:hypothetical protein
MGMSALGGLGRTLCDCSVSRLNVRSGSLADIETARGMSALPPIADKRERGWMVR